MAAWGDVKMMSADEYAALRLAAGETRDCVVCGMVRPASDGREAPGAGCWVPDACTWNMTPQEAADHWRKLAHDRAARIARLESVLSRIITPAPGVTEPAPPWVVGIAVVALERGGE